MFIFLLRSSGFKSKFLRIQSNFRCRTILFHNSKMSYESISSRNYDTIYAMSSGPIVKTGVSVIRISGIHSKLCLKNLFKPNTPFPEKRIASLRKLYCPETGELLDKALVIFFPSPNSFTGEDVVELHVHGSRAVIMGIFAALNYVDGKIILMEDNNVSNGKLSIRPADKGEFTRRAFDNGKMDLTEVEGLADLLEAETSQQRNQALKQMEGYLRVTFEKWREELIRCLAHTEAVIDFGDDDRENDVNDSAMWDLIPRIRELRSNFDTHLKDGKKGEIVREGIRIALTGIPNAGKSSLMNCLARRPAAIVSPIAGTTRDIVEVRMELGGLPCIISDTAGLRENSIDIIEVEGIKRAKEAFKAADIKIFVVDASDSKSIQTAKDMFHKLLDDCDNESIELNPHGVIFLLNKIDLVENFDQSVLNIAENKNANNISDIIGVSCSTGKGISEFENYLSRRINKIIETNGESVLITRERHRNHLKKCCEHLDRFLSCSLPMDAAAEELRLATQELGRVTGTVDVEELLDVIFRDFCIGK